MELGERTGKTVRRIITILYCSVNYPGIRSESSCAAILF
jgi:hypothetical protein